MAAPPLVSPEMFYLIMATNGGALGMQVPPAMDQLPMLPEPQPPVGLFPEPVITNYYLYPSFPVAPPTYSLVPEADPNPFMLSDMSFIY